MAQEVEPNDSTANSIELGEKITGDLSSSSDRDGYSFSISEPSTITVEFDSPTNSSSNYFNIYIQDSEGNKLSAFSTGKDGTLTAAVNGSGTYFVVVQSDYKAGGWNYFGGTYDITVTASSGTGTLEIEPNDDTATPITAGIIFDQYII